MTTVAPTISVDELVSSIRQIQYTGIAFMILVVSTVGIRMYVRLVMLKKFDAADWAMVVTFLLSVAHISVSIANSSIAIEFTEGDFKLLNTYNNMFRAAGATYIATLVTLKVSLCCFFLHIFSHKTNFRMAIWLIIGLTVALGVGYLPIGNFTCAQFKVYPGVADTCPAPLQSAASTLFIMFSVVDIVGDFILTGLACGALWGSKLPLLTKISAGLLLCLGTLGGVASIVRLSIFLSPAIDAKYTQEMLDLVRWILIELGTGVVAANLAMIRPLFHAGLVRLGLITSTGTTVASRTGGVTNTISSRPTRNMSDGDQLLLNKNPKVLVYVEHELTQYGRAI